MTEKDYKEIQAPTKEEISRKKQRINTSIFSVLASILNLVFTVIFVFALMMLFSIIVHKLNGNLTLEQFSKFRTPILWSSVIIGIVLGYIFQNLLVKCVIHVFKLENKLDQNFVERYCKNKK